MSTSIDWMVTMGKDASAKRDSVPWQRNRLWLPFVFTLVGLASIATTVFALVRTLALEEQSRLIVDNALRSIRLVARIDHDVAERWLLLDQHVLVTNPQSMANIAGEIQRVDEDFGATMVAYEPLADFPDERETWERVKAADKELGAPIAQVLELSRVNRDREARDLLVSTSGRLAELWSDLETLIQINDREANRSFARILAIRRSLVITFLGIGLVAIGGLIVLGRWSVRQLARHDEQAARYARVLEERNRDLDAFAGHVAHDIRGPLSTISLAAHQLRGMTPEHSKTTELLGRGVRHMESLIEDLLALARVEAIKGNCDPAVAASKVCEDFARRFGREKGTLRSSVEHARVRCTDGLLEQVLVNLLDNALKYRRPDVPLQVEISGTVTERGYDLRVTDNGMGMSPQDAASAFVPFFRAERTRALPGTGLGLSIVKRVADASGGTVSMTSQLGQGASFAVHLSLSSDEAPDHG